MSPGMAHFFKKTLSFLSFDEMLFDQMSSDEMSFDQM